MMILGVFRRYSRMSAAGWIPGLAIACCLGFGTAGARAQMSQAEVERIEMLRSQIKSAEAQHASAAEVGELWLRLANRYQDQLKYAEAEDAFARSLKLLRTAAEDRAAYADALDGMGSLDLAMGRLSEAGDYLRKALGIYEGLGDGLHAATVHETIALTQLVGRRYREAEAGSAEALKEFQSLAQPDVRDMGAAYLTHSYALCNQGRCGAALEDVNHAMAAIQGKLPANSLEMVAAWETRGFDEWKSGSVDEGGEDMREALRILSSRTDLPRPVVVNLQLGVLRQHAELLKASHRKPEAAQVEAEMGRLESRQPAGCSGCTVSVAALGFVP